MENPISLSEGVYAEYDCDQLIIMTEDPDDPHEAIYLDETAFHKLVRWVKQNGFFDKEDE
jgi:hypothetical protein